MKKPVLSSMSSVLWMPTFFKASKLSKWEANFLISFRKKIQTKKTKRFFEITSASWTRSCAASWSFARTKQKIRLQLLWSKAATTCLAGQKEFSFFNLIYMYLKCFCRFCLPRNPQAPVTEGTRSSVVAAWTSQTRRVRISIFRNL